MTLTESTTYNVPAPALFAPPPVSPSPGGLWAATTWVEAAVGEALPWLVSGVALESARVGNFSGELSSGVWGAGWCDEPGSGSAAGEVKEGVRPDDPDLFSPVTAWAYDACDLRVDTQPEILTRVQQVLTLKEPVLVAHRFAERMVLDAGPLLAADDLVAAVGLLEAEIEETNTLGWLHCSPYLRAHLASHLMAARSGVGYVSPGGHAWVFDAGYRDVLGDNVIVATSALFGWRGQVAVRPAVDAQDNTALAIAERSSIIACEQVISAVQIGGAS